MIQGSFTGPGLISLWLCIFEGWASGVFSALRPATQWDLKPCFPQTASPAASSSRCVPTRVLLGDYDVCSKALPWHGCEKAWQFYSSTQPYPTYRFLWVNATNAYPSCKQISWMFNDFHASVSSTQKLDMPGIPSPGIVLAWLTVPWASARNSRSAHRTKRPKYFCPAADGTSARLSASMASKKSWASRSLLPWILLQGIIHRKIPKRCGQSGVMSSLLVVGQREFEEAECNDQKMGTLWWTRCGVSWKFWTKIMTKQYFEKKSDGWLKIFNSKEERQ